MCHLKFLLFVLSFGRLGSVLTFANYLFDNFPATIIEDSTLKTPQLLKKYGYPVETHYVTTKDQYILCLYRIPNPGGRPVFLMHGLTDSSDTWIQMGPESGLGYFLHDNGYDVWMGNARGNRYSRNHALIHPDSRSFWTFSWHEIGMYDLPAMIDYVLKKTSAAKLGYVGHSQGTTSFWVMCSMRPEYNKKISVMNALAPVAFMNHVKTPYMSFKWLIPVVSMFTTEFAQHTQAFLRSCFQSQRKLETCLKFVWKAIGPDDHQMDTYMWLVAFGHMPAGCNLKQIKHFVQLYQSGRFCQFDYNLLENMKRYGRPLPPDYPLERITVPVGLYYGQNDYLTSVADVQRLSRSLRNVVDRRLYINWNHYSMVWGTDARELAHKRMLKLLNKYASQ